MTTLTEGQHAGEFIVSEANKTRSREPVTVLSGQDLAAGAVLGQITGGIGGAPVPAVVGTGNGTMTLVKPGPDVQSGSYVVTCTAVVAHGGVFSVVAPDGTALPVLTLTPGAGGTTAYSSSHIDFSVTDGSTDFAADDVFTIVVSTTAPVVIGTGNGVMTLLSLGSEFEAGSYRVECTAAVTNGGTFSIEAPGGSMLESLILTAGAGTTTAYTSEQINFSITDGSTDFIVGDYFYVVVFGGSNSVVAWDPTGVDGREDPYGILFDAVDASAAAVAGVAVVRDAEVNADELQWATTVTAAQKAVANGKLADNRGVIVR